MKVVIKGIVILLLILYPFLVAWSLSHGQFVWISILLIAVGVLRLITKSHSLLLPLTGFAILCGSLSLILQNHFWLKMYPVLMSLGALAIFAITLSKPPSMIERFARLTEPNLPESGVVWTRKVTKIWCVFFALNAVIAFITVLFTPTHIWVFYNGFLSYVLMGLLLVSEFIFRKRQQRLNQNH